MEDRLHQCLDAIRCHQESLHAATYTYNTPELFHVMRTHGIRNIVVTCPFRPTELFYDPNELWKALGHMMSVSNELESVETFRYDLVDLWRQVLSDRFLQVMRTGRFVQARR